MTKKIRIVTHDSKFHADEVLAVAVLHLILGDDTVETVRSRDPEIVATGDFVVDVGHVYDPQRNRYDHHQAKGAGVRPNGIPYASFGLVWKQFGEKLCGSKSVADEIESVMVIPIDATDNGVATIKRVYQEISPYDFHDAIDIFNPHVSESVTHDVQFLKVLEMAKSVIEREIVKTRLRQEDDQYVHKIYNQTKDKRLIVLDRPTNTRFLGTVEEPLFCMIPSATGPEWTVHAIRIDPELFDYRAYFPKEWAGKIREDLALTSGVRDAIFCHAHLFIAVAKSKEGALALARLALKSS
ncbi:MAG: MYG1 family protein [Patescibacteria group bacterium]